MTFHTGKYIPLIATILLSWIFGHDTEEGGSVLDAT